MEGTMKQLLLTDKGGPWALREVPIPKPGPGQLLVKVLAASVCNQTDLNAIKALHPPHDMQNALMLPHHLRVWDGRLEGDPLAKYYNQATHPLKPYPSTMGHEGMGEVVEIGPREPRSDKPSRDTEPVIHVGDRVAFGGAEATLGQYIITTPESVAPVADNITNEEASLLEPGTIFWGSCRAMVSHNDTVCILGQGALGLFATQWSRIYGARTIITTDPLPVKRALSKKLGADYVLDPTAENITAEIDRLTNGRGCDVVFECAGEPDSIMNVPYLAAFGAKVCQIGACCVPVTTEWGYIHFKGLTVYSGEGAGAANGFTRYQNRLVDAMNAFSIEKERGRLHLSDMITHRYKLTVEDMNELFREIDENGSIVKAIVDPWVV